MGGQGTASQDVERWVASRRLEAGRGSQIPDGKPGTSLCSKQDLSRVIGEDPRPPAKLGCWAGVGS